MLILVILFNYRYILRELKFRTEKPRPADIKENIKKYKKRE